MTTRRKSALVKDARGSLRGESPPPVIDYMSLSPDDLAEHLLDHGGLVGFVEAQTKGLPRQDWDWTNLSRAIWALSGKTWLMMPETVESIYEMQVGRATAA